MLAAAHTTSLAPDRIPTRLVFTTGDDWRQVATRLATRSPASHVILALGPRGEKFLHTYEDGVVLEDRDYWLKKEKQRIVAEYVIVPDVSNGVLEALTYVGEKYDVPGILRGGLIRVFGLLASPIYSFGTITYRAQTCSRFVMLIDPLGEKIHEWRYVNREHVSPGDLLVATTAGPSFRRIR